MKKTILYIFVLISLVSNYSLGENAPYPNNSDASGSQQDVPYKASFPDISFHDLIIYKDIYDTGEVIQGTFIIENTGEVFVDNLHSEIMLATNYAENGLAETILDSKIGPRISLKPYEKKIFPFTYTIPKGIGGEKYGIQVQIYNQNDVPLKWRDSNLFTILGGKTPITVNGTDIKSGAEYFPLLSGPMMYREGGPKELSLEIALLNSTDITEYLRPNIIIHDRSFLGSPLHQENGDEIIIAPQETKNYILNLPNFGYQPGVYLGSVAFFDQDNNQRTAEMFFRYIVHGNQVNIQNVVFQMKPEGAPGEFSLDVFLTGMPFDITQFDGGGIMKQSLKIVGEIQNEQGKNFFSFQKQEVIMTEGFLKITGIGNVSAKELKLSLKVYDENDTILREHDALVWTGDINGNTSAKNISHVVIVVLILFIGAFGLYRLFKHKRSIPHIHTILLCILIIGVTGGAVAPKVFAYERYYEWYSDANQRHLITGSRETINTPNVNQAFQPGERFYVTGTGFYEQCMNYPMNYKIHATSNGQTYSDSKYNQGSCGNGLCPGARPGQYPNQARTKQFSFGPFYAEDIPGEYTSRDTGKYFIDFLVEMNNKARAKGYQPYRVVAVSVNYTLAITTAGTGGGATTGAGTYTSGTPVTATATPDATSTFTGWSGDCNASGQVTMNANKACIATFNLIPITATCSSSPTSTTTGQPITWTASNILGGTGTYTFSWSGTDGLSGNTNPLPKAYSTAGTKNASILITSGSQTAIISCTAATVTAPVNYTLTITTAGTGGGTTTGAGAYTAGTPVTATATPNTSSTFTGWSGDCNASGQVTMNANKTCTATFNLIPITATCSPSPTSANTGQPITWTASNILGGTGTYTFSWSGTDNLTGTTNPLSKTYATIGSKNASVVVTSGSQTQTITCPAAIVVPAGTDMCNNIEDIQATIPTGLHRDTAGNCVCGSGN